MHVQRVGVADLDWWGVKPRVVRPGNGDDTGAIQDALNGGGHILLAGDFTISAPLVVYSNTHLELDSNTTVTLTSGSNCRMLETPGVSSSTRSENITVRGGRWDRGANAGGAGGNNLHGLVFRKVDGLTVRDIEFTSSGGKFGCLVVDCTEWVVDGFHADSCHSDGVHVQGPSTNGTIRNVHGTAGDDLVAITPLDYTGYTWGDEGNVKDVVIENIHGVATSQRIVRLVSGASLEMRNVRIKGVSGTCSSYPINVGSDSANTNTATGVMDEIVIEDVRAVGGSGYAQVFLNPVEGKNFQVRGLRWKTDGSSNAGISVQSTGVLESLSVTDSNIVDGVASRGLVDVEGTIERLTINGVVGNTAASSSILRLPSGASSASVTDLQIDNVNVEWATTTGSVISAVTSTQTLTRAYLSNVRCNSAWIADIATDTTFLMTNVYASGGQFNIRSGSSSVIMADQSCLSNSGTVTNAGTLASRGLGFRVDVSGLTNTAGDMAFNTNAGLACGSGPVIANGTLWKHLYTGTTT